MLKTTLSARRAPTSRGAPMNLTLETIRDIDHLVRSRATYVNDPEMRDTWTSYAKEVLAGRFFTGDCDDWAQTAIHLLVIKGADRKRLYRALVSSTGTHIDHMIGLVELDNGEMWSVGDTFGPPQKVIRDRVGQHLIIQTSCVAEKTLWRAWGGKKLARETNTAAVAMTTSDAGVDFIKSYEKLVRRAYDDHAPRKTLKPGDTIIGELTIGYGHTGPDVTIGLYISEARALEILKKDLKVAERGVQRLVRVGLTQTQFDALVSFVFNVGETQFARSTLLRKINAKASVAQIQAQFRRWVYDNGKELPGLVRRRNAEAALWTGEVVTHGSVMPMYRVSNITASGLVEEDRSPARSKDIWALGGATGLGSVGVLSQIKDLFVEAKQSFEDFHLLYMLVGVIVAGLTAWLLYKRLREILVEAKR